MGFTAMPWDSHYASVERLSEERGNSLLFFAPLSFCDMFFGQFRSMSLKETTNGRWGYQ